MNIIRITKQFVFETAHALWGYDGLCKNIHGHSYQLDVTVKGHVLDDKNNPKDGMVIDFSVIKDVVQEQVVSEFDHALLLNGNSPHKDMVPSFQHIGRIVLVNYQPTCENMLIDIASRIRHHLPHGIHLHHLKLRETPSSYAEWHADDNLESI